MEWLVIIGLLWIVSSYLYHTSTFKPDYEDNLKSLEEELAYKKSLLSGSRIEQPKPAVKPKSIVHYTDSTPDLAPSKALMFISAEDKLAYMLTKEWTELKQLRLVIANHKCECCGSAHNLHLHHVTYERLTQELLSDVVILCSLCHTKLHNILGYDRTTLYPISTIKD